MSVYRKPVLDLIQSILADDVCTSGKAESLAKQISLALESEFPEVAWAGYDDYYDDDLDGEDSPDEYSPFEDGEEE